MTVKGHIISTRYACNKCRLATSTRVTHNDSSRIEFGLLHNILIEELSQCGSALNNQFQLQLAKKKGKEKGWVVGRRTRSHVPRRGRRKKAKK